MTEQIALNDNTNIEVTSLPELSEAEKLANDLKGILVRSDHELLTGEARDNVGKLELWLESYRHGLSAAQKISDNGSEMLKKTRDQLKLSLDELLRLEDEGGNPPNKEHVGESEELARAIRHIDNLMPVVEQSFQSAKTPGTEDV